MKLKRKLETEGKEERKEHKSRAKKRDDPEVKGAILAYIEEHGFYDLKCRTLREYVLTKVAESKVPSLSNLRILLRDSFHLRKYKFSGSQYKYRDPTYNEKRLWVSRLLA